MKLQNTFSINLKKLKYRTKSGAFLILPITLLVALALIISSQSSNLQAALNTYVFSKLQNDNTVLQLQFQRQAGSGDNFSRGAQVKTSYNEADAATISKIANVTGTSIDYRIPLNSATTTDLVSNSTINLNNLVSLESDMASLYTDQSFDFSAGKTVPIILNVNSLQETYEDWGGQTSLSVNFRQLRGSGQNPSQNGQNQGPEQNSPVKTKVVNYDKNELLNKTFTANFGGLNTLPDFKTSFSDGSITFTQLTTDEISQNTSTRDQTISPYWNIDQLKKPLNVTFKVVGLIEDKNNTSVYVPDGFGDYLVDTLNSSQQQARTSLAIPTTDLGSTFSGLYYNGTELTTQAGSNGFGGGFGGGQGGLPDGALGGQGTRSNRTQQAGENNSAIAPPDISKNGVSTAIVIPGLILDTDSSNEVTGTHTDANVLSQSLKTGQNISLKVDSILHRTQVINDLNKAGFAYVDTNNLDALTSAQSNLSSLSQWVTIFFIVLTALVIIITMSKFVSESTREIGIFRAVGFTKTDILAIFMTQGLLYTFVGYILGVAIGFIGNLATAHYSLSWFSSLVSSTVPQSLGISTTIDSSVLSGVNVNSLSALSGILLIITIIVTLIPAYRASTISPVEAIKSE